MGRTPLPALPKSADCLGGIFMKRNLFHIFIALALCLSSLPAPARAADTVPERTVVSSPAGLAQALNDAAALDPNHLPDDLAAEVKESTVLLRQDVKIDKVLQIDCDVTMDLMGCLLDMQGGFLQADSGRTVTIQSSQSYGAFNGGIQSANPTAAVAAMRGCNLTVRDICISAENGYCVAVSADPRGKTLETRLTLEQMDMESPVGGVCVHGSLNQDIDQEEGNYPILSLKGVQINDSQRNDATAESIGLYLAGMADTSIQDSQIYGAPAIGIQSGSLTIGSGACITGVGRYVDALTANGSGINRDGSALLIENHPAYAGHIKVTVEPNADVSSKNSCAIREVTADSWAGIPPEIVLNGGSLFSWSQLDSAVCITQADLSATLDFWTYIAQEPLTASVRGSDKAAGTDYAEIYEQVGLVLSEPDDSSGIRTYTLAIDHLGLDQAVQDDTLYEVLKDPNRPGSLCFRMELSPPAQVAREVKQAFSSIYQHPSTPGDPSGALEEMSLSSAGRASHDIEVYYGSYAPYNEDITVIWLDQEGYILAVTHLAVNTEQMPEYPVDFDTGGGSPVQGLSVTRKIPKPADPSKEGFRFDGWYRESYLKTKWDFEQDIVTRSTTLFAKWTQVQTVTFDSRGGSPVNSQETAPGGKVKKPADPSREGYVFGGWYQDSACQTPWNFSTGKVNQSLTLYAKWTQLHTVTFDSQGGSQVDAQTVAAGNKASRPPAPNKPGFTFSDWYRESACRNLWDFDVYTVNQDVTLYARWNPLPPAVVTFRPNGGTVSPASATVQNGRLASLPTPVREGYTFGGWFTSSSGGTAITTETEFLTDTTIYAHWTVNAAPPAAKYTVAFDSQGGSAVRNQQVAQGSKVQKPSDPARSGYRFDAWYMEKSCQNAWKFDVYTVSQDTTLYAKWISAGTSEPDPGPAQYQVTFDSRGGSAVASQTVTSGGKVSKPADPARSGFDFGGWYLDNLCKTPWSFDRGAVTQNITLYAKWTPAGADEPDPGPNPGPNPGQEDEEYFIRVRSDFQYGEVYVSQRYALPGEQVTVTVEPDPDARLSWLDAESSDGRLLRLSQSGSRYRFTMPAANVTIDAGFTLLNTYSGSSSPSSKPVKTTPKPTFPSLAYRPAGAFQDLSWDSWSYSAAQWAYQNGFLDTAPDGSFYLNGPVSHQEMWKILARWQGAFPVGPDGVVAWARQSGVSKSTSPGSSMSRQDLVTYLYKCYFLMGGDVSAQGNLSAYPDQSLIKVKFSRDAWLWAVDRGLISGTADGRLNPHGAVTRAEFAAILMRLCQM